VAGLVIGAALIAAVLWLGRGPAAIDYLVVRGDTLHRIATAHDVSVEDLKAWNGLEGDLIQVGQVLRIHAGEPAPQVGSARSASTPRPRSTATSGSARSLPPEQPCLPPPDLDAVGEGDEAVYLASKGLSKAAVDTVMGPALQGLVTCVPEGSQPDGVMTLDIEVACTGRVSTVRVIDDGALPEELVDCVTDNLRYAAFPAHDLPDGFGFELPVSFRW